MNRQEFTQKQKVQAMLDCNGKCKMCGEKILGKVEYDHDLAHAICSPHGIKSNDQSNCIPLHPECHKIKTRGDLAEITKRNRQNKRYGEAAGGELEVAFPPVKKKSQWQNRKFDKPPSGYKHWRKK